MVEMVDAVTMKAPPEAVSAIARDIEGYSDLIPEYRGSRILRQDESGTMVERQGRILGVPARWVSRARIVSDDRVEFEQLEGLLKGMRTTWQIRPQGEGTHLEITHVYSPRLPLLGDLVARHIVHRLVVGPLARKILNSIKARVEGANVSGDN